MLPMSPGVGRCYQVSPGVFHVCEQFGMLRAVLDFVLLRGEEKGGQ